MNNLLEVLPPDVGQERRRVAVKHCHDKSLQKWLAKCAGKKAPAVVLGSGPNCLSFTRSLGRRGVPTLVLDSKRYVGTYSRYATAVLLPPANESPHQWIDFLEFVGSQLNSHGVLFATSDVSCQFVANHKNALERHFRFLVPDADTVGRIVDKRLQYLCADKAGIDIPKTYFPESLEQLRIISVQMDYPCILKPYIAHLGRPRLSSKKLLVVNTAAELITAYGNLADGNVSFMVQEIIPGDNDALFGYLAFWDAQGCELAWLTKRKLRQHPPLYGDGSLQITVNAPEVAEQSRRLMRAFDYRGFCSVEYKYDFRDKSYRLMEINPRTVSGNQLAIDANVDLPWIGYRSLLGHDRETIRRVAFRLDVKLVNEAWDFQAYLALRKTGKLNLLSWLRSLRGAKPAIWAWDDPFPILRSLGSFLRRVGSRLVRSLTCPHGWRDQARPRRNLRQRKCGRADR